MTAGAQYRTLVLDRRESVAERTAETLAEDYGIDATAVADAEALTAALADGTVDCVVSDIGHPEMDGEELLGAVREESVDLPVVLLVDRDADLPADAIAAGTVDYTFRFEVTEDGQYARLASRIEAVVDCRRTREELAGQTERLESFAGVVSHDLRNPLNVAQSSVELVRDDFDNEHLERVDRSLARMNRIIEDGLVLVRESDPVENPSPVALETMVRDAWAGVDTDGTELVVEATDRIEADADLLKEALRNLFENAVEHGAATTVTVGSLSDAAGDCGGDFYVADDGEGIAPDRREEAFEPGYSTARGGTGLGLTLVRTIANAHGWSVTATESADGGARFELTGVAAR
ncbi:MULTISPECIES: hybrid sensor histidine kinase/response regulator [Salinibaculum]|uniref:hybrid sensor histidine kinase/response regulator n=1 Tax=Salinibaculum TaxID=2732368 RepID=UPI0030D065CB